jgi:DNA-binding NtrC family response regulator
MASRAPFAHGDLQPRLLPGKSRSRPGAAAFGDMVVGSPGMARVVLLGHRAATCTLPLLIEGEPGVGKERLARAIHATGATRKRPFTVIDCASGSANRLDDLLAMRERSVDDRRSDRRRNQPAGPGGTLFLRQVGALTAEEQELLLGLIDTPKSDKVRPNEPPNGGFRIVAATGGRLVNFVARGSFRDDLFQRLNVLPIWIPPLRERRSDIPELARSFLAQSAAEPGGAPVEISQEALALLVAQDWPGNVSQLRTAIIRAVALAAGSMLVPEDLERVLPALRGSTSAMGTTEPAGEALAKSAVAGARQTIEDRALNAESLPDTSRPARYGVARLLDERGELRRFEALEAEVIRFAVDHCRGRMSEVARRLGIGRSTLYRKLKDYGIASGAVGAS